MLETELGEQVEAREETDPAYHDSRNGYKPKTLRSSMRSLDIPFTLKKGEAERTSRYVPEGDSWIGDHVKVREVNVSFTKVQAYLTVDYDYDPRPEEEMGVWLHPYDAAGNAITTSRGSGGGPEDEDELGFYRQWSEMQSFNEVPDVIVLDGQVIDSDSLGQCVCRLVKSE